MTGDHGVLDRAMFIYVSKWPGAGNAEISFVFDATAAKQWASALFWRNNDTLHAPVLGFFSLRSCPL